LLEYLKADTLEEKLIELFPDKESDEALPK
jgi:hypothetical protein